MNKCQIIATPFLAELFMALFSFALSVGPGSTKSWWDIFVFLQVVGAVIGGVAGLLFVTAWVIDWLGEHCPHG